MPEGKNLTPEAKTARYNATWRGRRDISRRDPI